MGVALSHLGLLSSLCRSRRALGRCDPDQRAPSPALAKEDVLYATRPKPPAQLIRATRSQACQLTRPNRRSRELAHTWQQIMQCDQETFARYIKWSGFQSPELQCGAGP